jgi:SsrA-binding protein
MENPLVKNRKAHFEYEILEKFEAGIVLKGHEAKSIRNGGGNFTGSFVTLNNGEVWVKNFTINLYEKSTVPDYEPKRPRKLLLRKAEIQKIVRELNTSGVTVIPLSCGLKKGKLKIEIALARGKKQHDKRHDIKRRDQKRQLNRQLGDY